MAGPQQFPDEVRDRLIAAVCDEGLGPKQAWRMAGAGELERWDPSWPVPSFTTIRDWRKLEERARAERRIMDREKPIGDVIDSMQRRVLKLCERDLKRLENAPPGKVDYVAMSKMLEAVRKVAQATGAEPRRSPAKRDEGEKIPQSGVLEAVQAVAAQSRATSAQSQQGKTETPDATRPQPQDQGEQNGRRHLLQEAEQRAARATAGNGGSSTATVTDTVTAAA
jgi:hypothetical protein